MDFDVRQLSYICVRSLCGIAVAADILLLYLTYKARRVTFLKEFNKIVHINTALDLYLIANMLLNDIEIAISDGYFFVFSNGNYWPVSDDVRNILAWNFHCCCGLSGIFGIVPLYFRYRTFVKGERVQLIKVIPWILCPVWNTFWASFSVFKYAPIRHEYLKYLDADMWADGPERFFIITDVHGWTGVLYGLSSMVTFTFAFSYAIVMVRRIQQKLHEQKDASERTKKMQSQLNRIVICQLILSVLLGITPVTGAVSQVNLQIHGSNFHFVMITLMTALPVANAVSTILLIRHYRVVLWQLAKCAKSGRAQAKISTIESGSAHCPIGPIGPNSRSYEVPGALRMFNKDVV